MSEDERLMAAMETAMEKVAGAFSGQRRDPERIEPMLSMLRALWTSHPDYRLTQLIVNLTGKTAPEVFYFEDDALEQKLREALKSGEA